MNIDKKRAKKAFAEYVLPYNVNDEKIKLKIAHTYRVCELCELISKGIGLSDEDSELAWLCGLLHDVGRFEQVRRFKTFNDSLSVDHAMLSAQILFDEGKISDYIDDHENDSFIRTVIENHSRYRIEENLDERTAVFCNILRDADKVDIFRVNTESPLEEIYNVTSEELHQSEISEAVMKSFEEEHATLRKLKKTPIDNVAGHISLVYELVYDVSLAIAKEQGYIDKLADFESDNPKANKQLKEIRESIKNYIQKRIQ